MYVSVQVHAIHSPSQQASQPASLLVCPPAHSRSLSSFLTISPSPVLKMYQLIFQQQVAAVAKGRHHLVSTYVYFVILCVFLTFLDLLIVPKSLQALQL